MEIKRPTAKRGASNLAIVTLMIFATVCAARADQMVNIASPVWGTQIEATSTHGSAHAAWNVADGSVERGHSWLSADDAPLPQTLTLKFAEPFSLTQVRIRQAQWDGSMYHTRDFKVEIAEDGTTFHLAGAGTLADEANSDWTQSLSNTVARAVRIIILSSYTTKQTCGLGEVELMASVSADRQPPFAWAAPALNWKTLRGLFRLQFDLDPPPRSGSSAATQTSLPSANTRAGLIKWSSSRRPGVPPREF